MPRILLANEYGGGFGHARRLAEFAGLAQEVGIEPVLALTQYADLAPGLAAAGWQVIPGPLSQQHPMGPPGPTAAAGLAAVGLTQVNAWVARGRAWARLLDEVRPDAVMVDSAPVLALVAGDRLPVVGSGAPYSLPPPSPGWPARDGGRATPAELAVIGQIEAAVRQAASRLGVPAPRQLGGLWRGTHPVPAFLPAVDSYAAQREAPAWGRLFPFCPVASERSRIFAYLDGEGAAPLLEAALPLGLPIRAVIKGSAVDLPGVEVLPPTQDFQRELPAAQLVLTNGSLGLLEQAALAGTPVAGWASFAEHRANLACLVREGVAVDLGARPREAWTAALREARDLRPAGERLAARLAPLAGGCRDRVREVLRQVVQGG